MDNTREKLIELLFGCVSENLTLKQNSIDRLTMEIHHGDIADHLIANGVTVQEWISVKDRLPQDSEDVLVFGYWHEKFQPLMCYLSPHRKGEWFTTVAGQQVYTVTHWMPLPTPPKEV